MEKIPEQINIENLEEKLRIFLVEILKVPIERGDIYQTLFHLDQERRTRFYETEIFTNVEKEYINKHIS